MSDDSLRRFEELDADAREEYLRILALLAVRLLRRRGIITEEEQNVLEESDRHAQEHFLRKVAVPRQVAGKDVNRTHNN